MESEVGESSVSADYGDRESSPTDNDSPSDSETEPIQKKLKLTSETIKEISVDQLHTPNLTCRHGRRRTILSHGRVQKVIFTVRYVIKMFP